MTRAFPAAFNPHLLAATCGCLLPHYKHDSSHAEAPAGSVQVAEAKQLADPPLLRLELEASHAYLAMLTQLGKGDQAQQHVAQGARVEERTVAATLATLEAFLVRPCCHSRIEGCSKGGACLVSCCCVVHVGCTHGEGVLRESVLSFSKRATDNGEALPGYTLLTFASWSRCC